MTSFQSELSTSKTDKNVEQIGKLILGDCQLTIQKLANEAGIRYGVMVTGYRSGSQEISTENSNMRSSVIKFVLRFLTSDFQRQHSF